jgi:hypothetical protein
MYPEEVVDSPEAVDDECDNDNKYDEECDEVETVSQEVVNDTLKTPGL